MFGYPDPVSSEFCVCLSASSVVCNLHQSLRKYSVAYSLIQGETNICDDPRTLSLGARTVIGYSECTAFLYTFLELFRMWNVEKSGVCSREMLSK